MIQVAARQEKWSTCFSTEPRCVLTLSTGERYIAVFKRPRFTLTSTPRYQFEVLDGPDTLIQAKPTRPLSWRNLSREHILVITRRGEELCTVRNSASGLGDYFIFDGRRYGCPSVLGPCIPGLPLSFSMRGGPIARCDTDDPRVLMLAVALNCCEWFVRSLRG